jgi:hypothetical protein
MSELNIQCPHCGKPIELTEALTGPVLQAERRKADADSERRLATERQAIEEAAAAGVRAEYADVIADLRRASDIKDAELLRAKETEVASLKAIQQADEATRNVDLQVARRVGAEAEAAAVKARAETAKQFGARLQAAEAALADTDAKRQAAEEAELAALTAKRDAEEMQRTAELAIARRLEEERGKVRDQAIRERDEEHRLRVADKDKQLADLKTQVDELQRRTEQSSPQLVGEVLEVDLFDVLTAAFPMDRFERVGRGQRGADVRQSVIGPGGPVAGVVLWEAKRTKTWSDGWLPKLRENQRAAKADVAVIVSETLPADVLSFDFMDGVWVSGYTTALPLAAALRQGLIETARARRAAAGADQTKDIAYTYLMGTEFRRRVTGLLEPVVEMRAGLEAEQRSMTRQWCQRGKQIDRMALGVAGIYGDLQGILGPNLPQVEGLTLPDAGTNDRPDTPRLESGDAADAVGEVH